jgi:hypothetical protein
MCGCVRVYAYLGGCLNQRALLDQHSHCIHVPVRTRVKQRCIAVLPSQPASVRRSGAAAATQATVHACASTCAHALCVRLNKIMCIYVQHCMRLD